MMMIFCCIVSRHTSFKCHLHLFLDHTKPSCAYLLIRLLQKKGPELFLCNNLLLCSEAPS